MNPEVNPTEITPDPSSDPTTGSSGWKAAPRIDLRSIKVSDVLTISGVIAALGLAYAPNISSLVRTWNTQPDYSHGFLVIPIALVILWKTWPKEPEMGPRVWMPGWSLVIAGLLARSWYHELGQTWSESATLLPVITGLALVRLGWRTMFRTWPAFAFLLFLFPLPDRINSSLSQPLQSLATTAACALLKLTGLWVMPDGNVIQVGTERLEVAAACNGLSMLMSLAATVAAMASLVPMANWKRIVLLLSIVPIALGSNVLRISATAWCYYAFGSALGNKYAHDAAGWLMMPTAMVLVGLELLIMSWLVVETDESELQRERQALARTAVPRDFEDRP